MLWGPLQFALGDDTVSMRASLPCKLCWRPGPCTDAELWQVQGMASIPYLSPWPTPHPGGGVTDWKFSEKGVFVYLKWARRAENLIFPNAN